MNEAQHSWASEGLVVKAEGYADEILRSYHPPFGIFFIPLADFDRRGSYYLHDAYPRLVVEGGWQHLGSSYQWRDDHPFNQVFSDFFVETRSLSSNFRELLIDCIAFALAHGMDVVCGQSGGTGISVLTGVTHSAIHGDIYGV